MPSWLLIVLELVGVGLVVAGVALVWLPAALMLAGVAVILACERRSAVARPGREARRP